MTEPDWFEINKFLSQPKITLDRLYQDYEKQVCPEHRYSYPSFCRRYSDRFRQNGIRSQANTSQVNDWKLTLSVTMSSGLITMEKFAFHDCLLRFFRTANFFH